MTSCPLANYIVSVPTIQTAKCLLHQTKAVKDQKNA
jgi:hypothetical protein